MSALSILALAVALSMDAAAAAAARGLAAPVIRLRQALAVALLFGGFQAAMPVAGWALGTLLGPAVAAWDHWIAFVLLAGLGVKMLHEAATAEAEVDGARGDPFALRVLALLALATSLDALAAGATLPLLGAPLAASVATIGVTTALLSVAALYAGRRCGSWIGGQLDAFGGVVLIAIAGKILFEHLHTHG